MSRHVTIALVFLLGIVFGSIVGGCYMSAPGASPSSRLPALEQRLSLLEERVAKIEADHQLRILPIAPR